MRLWMLIGVQLGVLALSPLWVLLVVFAPLALTNNPQWAAFLFFLALPGTAVVFSIVMWVARAHGNERWQKIAAGILLGVSGAALFVVYGST